MKSPYRIEKTDDPRSVTISIDLDALPIKPNLGEPDAVRLVLAALAATNPSPAAAEALERVETPEALHAVFAVAGAAEEVSDDLRAALHQQWTVRGHRIREAVNDDEVMASILRRCLPAYEGPPLIVYRGEQAERAERVPVNFDLSVQLTNVALPSDSPSSQGKTMHELNPMYGLGLEQCVNRLVEYNSSWPLAFAEEAARIKAVLGDRALAIEQMAAQPFPDFGQNRSSIFRSGSQTFATA